MSEPIKKRARSYSFWVSLASAILLLVQTVGRPLGLVIDEATYMSIVNSVLGVFVVLGIISHPSQSLFGGNSSEGKKEEVGDDEKDKKSQGEGEVQKVALNDPCGSGKSSEVNVATFEADKMNNYAFRSEKELSAESEKRLKDFKEELNKISKV